MMVKEERIFSDLITLIDNKPVKFNVVYRQMEPDSGDRLNKHPYYYIFNNIPLESDHDFVVNASSLLYETYFRNNLTKLHFHSVKFGISQIRKGIKANLIGFGTGEYEAMRDAPKLDGYNLRHEILKFIYWINSSLPRQEIIAEDIQLNIDADNDKIEQWLGSLSHEEFLTKGSKDIVPNRFASGYRGIDTFLIDPRKRKEIEVDLNQLETEEAESRITAKLKIFFSYSNKNKALAGKIKAELNTLFMDVFLAHEDIKVSKKWEEKILQELQNCDILLALITKPFMSSEWTYQEAGNAIGRDKKIISLMHGGQLKGFLKRYQSVPFSRDQSKYLDKIIDGILDEGNLHDRFINGLIHGLKVTDNYGDSIHLSKRLMEIDRLNKEQINLIAQYAVNNDQVYGCHAMKLLEDIFKKNMDKLSEENSGILRNKHNINL